MTIDHTIDQIIPMLDKDENSPESLPLSRYIQIVFLIILCFPNELSRKTVCTLYVCSLLH